MERWDEALHEKQAQQQRQQQTNDLIEVEREAMDEQPFGPTAADSMAAILAGLFLIVVYGCGFLLICVIVCLIGNALVT